MGRGQKGVRRERVEKGEGERAPQERARKRQKGKERGKGYKDMEQFLLTVEQIVLPFLFFFCCWFLFLLVVIVLGAGDSAVTRLFDFYLPYFVGLGNGMDDFD